MKTWSDILRLGEDYLAGRGVPDARVAMELLMARLLKCGRGFLSPHLAASPSEAYLAAMRRGMARLVKGEPIQYVLGEWDFRALTLTCDKRALIPRPETEELVTYVLKFLRDRAQTTGEKPVVVDVGTGSGCILLALAQEYAGEGHFLGLDISPAAVALARENAARCKLEGRVTFVVADGLDDFDEPETVTALVSNPPYIRTADCATLDPRIRDYEPMNALDGGSTGLDFYERLVADAVNVLRPGGGVFFEIGDEQGAAVRKLLFDAGFNDIQIARDFAGHDRYALARR